MKVLFLPEIRNYFAELAEILYEKNYFGFESSAIRYVEDLFNDIADTLPKRYRTIAPKYFDKYGENMFYVSFKKTKSTEWYVFFSEYELNNETIFLVKYITNNHVSEAQYFNS
jgi:hypothetical protein